MREQVGPMFELKPPVPRTQRFLSITRGRSQDPRQMRLMIGALLLLLVALGLLLYRDRDFWLPDTDEVDDTMQGAPAETVAAATAPASPKVVASVDSPTEKVAHPSRHHAKGTNAVADALPQEDPPEGAFVTERTALPPLEIEVVAGESHRTVRSHSTAVNVDMDSGASPAISAPTETETSAAGVTSNAGERVQLSANTAAAVSRSVSPDYPVLARQMKVQGSVILQALISREGMIQNLRVLSGPPILASAAREAVLQWHFKPHFEGSDAVETKAKITVNFTISTN
jgi:TonB family protein